MITIRKVAVLGSGVMGSGIAAHMANAGIPVLLLDIVPAGAENRNVLTEKAMERMLATNPSPFVHKSRAKLVTCGNLEDDLNKLADVDWVVEAVLERLDVKQDVYRKVDAVRKPGCIISSNTSTLPLHELTKGMPATFTRDFMITHFFNPPRFMRLLEVVASPTEAKEAAAAIERFADETLGKGVVHCKDTPGFIANRIGVYWMMVALFEAMECGIRVEEADAVMSRPVGIPKTGVFGLFDLIGIDLMPLIARSMLATLPEKDAFHTLYREPELISKMIKDGYTGRKGKGGFYRVTKGEGGKKTKEVLDLKTGEYRPEKKAQLASVDAAKAGLKALVASPDIGGQYAAKVLLKTLHYAASLIPEISDDIVSVDEAMKLGYNWKYGPFELIDRLGDKTTSGTAFFAEALKRQGLSVPAIITAAAGKPLYDQRQHMTLAASYASAPAKPGVLMVSDLKAAGKPVLKNASASLWDMGEGIACLELTSKMNSIDPDILELIVKTIGKVKQDFKGLVIGNDGDNFSVGANLGVFLMAANVGAWGQMGEAIKAGQNAMMALKYAPFPVVSALSGMALGGGCEMVLHSNAVQAHVESYPGLVEVGVGVIPGWGGCKEMLLRHCGAQGNMQTIGKVFEMIATAKVAGSAVDAMEMKILAENNPISMNRVRVLADAKKLCLTTAATYQTPQPASIRLPGPSAKVAMLMAVDGFVASGKATPHDVVVCKVLAHVLSGGETDMLDELTEQQLLDLEYEGFMELIKTRGTLERIEHMLETGKPLRN